MEVLEIAFPEEYVIKKYTTFEQFIEKGQLNNPRDIPEKPSEKII